MKNSLSFVFIVLGFAVIGLGVYLAQHDFHAVTSNDAWAERGVRGDFWGGHISGAASLASAAFFVAALLLQGKELALQREELEKMRTFSEAQLRLLEETSESAKKEAAFLRATRMAEYRHRLAARVDAIEHGFLGQYTAGEWFRARNFLGASKKLQEFTRSSIKELATQNHVKIDDYATEVIEQLLGYLSRIEQANSFVDAILSGHEFDPGEVQQLRAAFIGTELG